jgi:glycine betaine/choline ABC-type transport system substrate-binding protein
LTPAEMISILKETLYKLSDKITDDEMRKMNYEVAVNK